MSTIFRFGAGPNDVKRVYADSGYESAELGDIDDYGRLIVHDEMMCSSVSISPYELEALAAFVRKHGSPKDGQQRTFESICKELAEHPAIQRKWKADFDDAPRTVVFTNERRIAFSVYDDGEMRIEPDIENGGYHSDIFTPDELAAFAAACQEIAALNRKADDK